MNEHAGPACALSVLIVGVFAVILHDKNPPPITHKSPPVRTSGAPDQARDSTPDRKVSEPVRENRPTSTKIDPPPSASRTSVSVPSSSLQETSLIQVEPAKVVEEPPPTAREKSPEPRETAPATKPAPVRSAFTIVKEGETLADVASRVYGSSDSAEALWRANRDQIPAIDSPLPRGTLLRTP